MAANDRTERFSKIRTWLDGSFSNKPSPHTILNQMLTVEQSFILRLTNTRATWHLIDYTLTTEEDVDTYEIEQPAAAYQNSGKVHFVLRSTDNEQIPSLPVPFDDFSTPHSGQMPAAGQVNPALYVPERISFYRTNIQNQAIKAVISPTPQEVLTYTIWFFAGSLDRDRALMANTGPITELSDYLDLKTVFALLPYAEWRDDDQFNENKRRSLGTVIGAQIAELEPIVDTYIKDLNAPKSFDMNNWNE